MATPSPVERFSLRVGEGSDVDGVMRVMDAAFGPEFGEAWTRSQLLGILPMGGVDLTVAVSDLDRSIVGFSLVRSVADEAELLLIAVHPDERGQGIGSRLLDRFIALAADVGLARVHLEVRDGNAAVTIYQRLGFRPVGRRRNYYQGKSGDRHDAITLALDMDSKRVPND